MEKFCRIHGMTTYNSRSDGGYRCGKCSSAAVTKRRRVIKQLAVEYMGGSCKHCGYSKCIEALEFHHLNPDKKDFGISVSGATRSFERVRVELDQCIMLCANCHREIHALS